MKYCLPVIKETKEEVVNYISENPDYDFYEIWISYIKDLDTDFIWKISEQYNGKLVFLFRKQNLEQTDLSEEIREKITKLLETSDNYLDLDINDQEEELEFVKKEKLENKLIVSYHNYEETPDLDKTTETMDSRVRGNDKEVVFKVSTFCKSPEDSIKLLTLLLKLKKEGKKFIILGMGEQGKIVRIYGALWGNEFNFAPTDENEKSAPGQLTRERLERILEVVK